MPVDLQQPDDTPDPRRAMRYRLRDVLQALLPLDRDLDRLRVCGKFRASADDPVLVKVSAGVAHYSNLQLCASVHACPVCSAKIRQQRATEIERAVERHIGDGGGVEFVTLTLRHHAGESLRSLLDGCAESFRAVLQHRDYRDLASDLEVNGSIRALEVTHGQNGWHPHLHVLLFTARPLKSSERRRLQGVVFRVWARALVRRGLQLPKRGPGCKVVAVRNVPGIAAYCSKVIGLELQRHDLKEARRAGEFSTRPVFAIARGVVEAGEVDDLALWIEYVRATKGRQSLTWSAGLKARLLVVEQTDDDIAHGEQQGAVVAVIGQALWSLIIRHRARWYVLELARKDPDQLPEYFARIEADAWEVARC